jgi:hypothetical protein
VLLNEIGLFRFNDNPGHIAEQTASSEGKGSKYYAGVYAVVTELLAQGKAGGTLGILKARPAFMPRERAKLESLSPPAYLSQQAPVLVAAFARLEADLKRAKSALLHSTEAAYEAEAKRGRDDLVAFVLSAEEVRKAVLAHRAP